MNLLLLKGGFMSISIQSNYNSKKKLSFFESHNILHDKWMKILTGNQWKMSCFFHRKTRGWQKFQDKISHSQCVEATGLSKNTCIKVINELIEMGRVGKFKTGGIGREECYYYLSKMTRWKPLDLSMGGNLAPFVVALIHVVVNNVLHENTNYMLQACYDSSYL